MAFIERYHWLALKSNFLVQWTISLPKTHNTQHLGKICKIKGCNALQKHFRFPSRLELQISIVLLFLSWKSLIWMYSTFASILSPRYMHCRTYFQRGGWCAFCYHDLHICLVDCSSLGTGTSTVLGLLSAIRAYPRSWSILWRVCRLQLLHSVQKWRNQWALQDSEEAASRWCFHGVQEFPEGHPVPGVFALCSSCVRCRDYAQEDAFTRSVWRILLLSLHHLSRSNSSANPGFHHT